MMAGGGFFFFFYYLRLAGWQWAAVAVAGTFKGAPAASPRLPQAPPMAIFNVANVNVQR